MGSLPLLLIGALFFVPSPVALTVRPAFAMQPGSFQATILIERHANNRTLRIGFDGPEHKESTLQIDGAQRQRVFFPPGWVRLSAGEYTAYAVLTRVENGTEKAYSDSRTFRVIGDSDLW